MISGDPAFTARGTITRINYSDRFRLYKKILTTNQRNPAITSLIDSLNHDLFGVLPTCTSARQGLPRQLPAVDSSLERLMQSLQPEMTDDEEPQ